MSKSKMVIIYLPNGNEAKYTTSKSVGGTEYMLVGKIECELTTVNIAYIEDGKSEGRSYVGMPYLLQLF